MKIAVNGFGRIGRNFVRTLLEDATAQKHISIEVINIGPARKDDIAYLFIYDTIMGTFQGEVYYQNDILHINGHAIRICAVLDPQEADWGQYDIDWVVDCTGAFTTREKAQLHLDAGARHVLISAPAEGEDITIIPGVNTTLFDDSKHAIVSLGSCTTNALLPMVKVMHDTFTIKQACMTTIHAYTNSQVLLDVERPDLRRSRAAALNIIPTTTGATKVLGRVLPELAGKVSGTAIRVPVAKVSLIDLVVHTQKAMTVSTIHDAFAQAMKGTMKNILDLSLAPLVSSDYSMNNHSVVIDGLLTIADGNMAQIFGWYDNEWGYSCRLKDFLLSIS